MIDELWRCQTLCEIEIKVCTEGGGVVGTGNQVLLRRGRPSCEIMRAEPGHLKHMISYGAHLVYVCIIQDRAFSNPMHYRVQSC